MIAFSIADSKGLSRAQRRHRALGLAPVFILSTMLCSIPAPFCRAADSESKPSVPFDLSHYSKVLRQQVGKMRQPEIVEMIAAIAHGSQMGPGEGWFHPSQSRYSWEWLADRYDADHNGTITRQEFDGPSELFERLDRNHDGVLTPADFDWSDRSAFARQSMPSRFWFRSIDRNSNGRISREEWQSFFEKIAKGKDYLTPDDLREALPVSPPSPPPGAVKNAGPSPLVLLKGLLSGELGSVFEGPDIGQPAPDFTLKTQDGKRQIRLSQYRGQKPVVLIFGSFT